jgi:A/G-specific adenine glycosylase
VPASSPSGDVQIRWNSLRDVQELLLGWDGRNTRDLPWRHTRDPYAILVSEVMLQQNKAS